MDPDPRGNSATFVNTRFLFSHPIFRRMSAAQWAVKTQSHYKTLTNACPGWAFGQSNAATTTAIRARIGLKTREPLKNGLVGEGPSQPFRSSRSTAWAAEWGPGLISSANGRRSQGAFEPNVTVFSGRKSPESSAKRFIHSSSPSPSKESGAITRPRQTSRRSPAAQSSEQERRSSEIGTCVSKAKAGPSKTGPWARKMHCRPVLQRQPFARMHTLRGLSWFVGERARQRGSTPKSMHMTAHEEGQKTAEHLEGTEPDITSNSEGISERIRAERLKAYAKVIAETGVEHLLSWKPSPGMGWRRGSSPDVYKLANAGLVERMRQQLALSIGLNENGLTRIGGAIRYNQYLKRQNPWRRLDTQLITKWAREIARQREVTREMEIVILECRTYWAAKAASKTVQARRDAEGTKELALVEPGWTDASYNKKSKKHKQIYIEPKSLRKWWDCGYLVADEITSPSTPEPGGAGATSSPRQLHFWQLPVDEERYRLYARAARFALQAERMRIELCLNVHLSVLEPLMVNLNSILTRQANRYSRLSNRRGREFKS